MAGLMTTTQPAPQPPPPDIVRSFGGVGRPEALPGGLTTAWRAGDVVFKPLDMTTGSLEWQAATLPTLHVPGVRLTLPVRAHSGELVVAGWTAWTWCPGRHECGRWAEVIGAGERLHVALTGLPKPSFLGDRVDRWARADRFAWGDIAAADLERRPHVTRLLALLRPIDQPAQLVHSDLAPNVLFDDLRPPAVIDLSLSWRPPGWASAIVVVDALAWQGADETLLAAVRHLPDFGQLFARALVFRVAAHDPDDLGRAGAVYAPVVDFAEELVQRPGDDHRLRPR